MKQLGSELKRHLKIYQHFLSFALKYMLEYRFNFFVRSIHNFSYVLMFFITTLVIYSHTHSLGGWSLDEALALFALTHISFGIQSFLFLRGVEEFMRLRVRDGTFDLDLLRPVNTQFMALFRTPWVDSILLTIVMSGFFIRQLFILRLQLSISQICLFMLNYILCTIIWYFIISTYATIAFQVTRAQQVMYFMEKASDFAQYPTSIFPQTVQWIFFTLVPVALFAYIPTSILLDRNAFFLWKITLFLLPLTWLINKITWQKGLKHYSSASS